MSSAALGTAAWLREVRSSLPVRGVLGRSRPTQQFAPKSAALGRNASAEGGNELTALLLLEALHAAGLVTWFKEQPFELTEQEHGVKAIPDFIFEWQGGIVYVLEVKSAKYLTVEVNEKLAQVASVINGAGMKYLVWTDKKQLKKPLWSNVRKLWSARGIFVSDTDRDKALSAVRKGPTTLGALLKDGNDPEVLMYLVAMGQAHFNLNEKRNEHTQVRTSAIAAHYHDLLGARPDPESWWNAIPALAGGATGVGADGKPTNKGEEITSGRTAP